MGGLLVLEGLQLLLHQVYLYGPGLQLLLRQVGLCCPGLDLGLQADHGLGQARDFLVGRVVHPLLPLIDAPLDEHACQNAQQRADRRHVLERHGAIARARPLQCADRTVVLLQRAIDVREIDDEAACQGRRTPPKPLRRRRPVTLDLGQPLADGVPDRLMTEAALNVAGCAGATLGALLRVFLRISSAA